jgi:hypothetical protein
MGHAVTDSGPARPVERFKPTNGFVLGYVGVLLAALTVGYVLVAVHTVVGLRVGLAAAFFGVVVWATQIRPRAAAYPETLLLKNAVRDFEVPLVLVDDVSVRQMLNVWVGDRRYVCIGIGESVRAMIKPKHGDQGSMLGSSRWHEFADRANRAAPEDTAMPYTTWVTTRIEELVEQAKKARPEGYVEATARPRVAWPALVALLVLGVAFLVSLFL